PWEAVDEFAAFFDDICSRYQTVTLIANSIGAFFSLNALSERRIEKAFFISPIVDMEKLIEDMMRWANVSEAELREKGEIATDFGQTLSWKYLTYVRNHPIRWTIPTHILYGDKDNLTAADTMSGFADRIGATLTVMQGGEHWFHTAEQMRFLDEWIVKHR
ncbi:MAG: alpha/beta hydrolase, partial [Clostridia bacterium]|nr:alpha/beta hydrolase [Clostridia bacterium]